MLIKNSLEAIFQCWLGVRILGNNYHRDVIRVQLKPMNGEKWLLATDELIEFTK